jgi:hypothetical protein
MHSDRDRDRRAVDESLGFYSKGALPFAMFGLYSSMATPSRRKARIHEFLVRVGLAGVPACSLRGRVYMGLASAGYNLLGTNAKSWRSGTWVGMRNSASCNWWDFWRGNVAIPHQPEFPCPKHTTTTCPYH